MSALALDVASQLKAQIDIVAVVGQYVELKRQGDRYVGLCPFHKEKTPSFKVSSTHQYYRCFGCDARGDILTFIREIEKLTFPEAIKHLAEEYSIPVVKTPSKWIDYRLADVDRIDAEIFRVGYAWALERYLELLKAFFLIEEPGPSDRRIHEATSLLQKIRNWSTRDLACFLKKYRRVKPRFVAACIREAKQAQADLAQQFSEGFWAA